MDDDMSSLPTNHESFSSQQNYSMEDDTIDLHGVDLDSEPNHVKDIKKNDKKRQRKAPSKPRKTFSECWNYFDPKFEPDENGVLTKMAYCKWCPAVYKADSVKNGTVNMNRHYVKCDKNPANEESNKQKKLAFKKKIGGDVEGGSTSGTLQTWKYDEKPSTLTIARDVSKFYLEERKDLVNFLSNSSTTVHLTTDTWTSSCKRMNFMVLTAHFIDDNWVMHKRIINFRPIHSHRGVDIGRALLECINGWGIKNVMTMTVDNIASNDKALEYLLENLPTKYDDDPTMKSEMIGYGFRHLIENGCIPMEVDEESQETPIQFYIDQELCDKLVKKVEEDMRVFFAMYKEKYGTNVSSDMSKSTSSQGNNTSRHRGNAFLNFFKDKVGNKLKGGEDELTKYLKEPRLVLEDDEDFNILNWWKLNSPRFPIVSRMAKDILSIQVSTVASESAFSASGRILDPYRNALAPNIVEALVCTQDWICTSSINITTDTLEDLMKDDDLAKEIQEGLDQQKGEQSNGKGKNFFGTYYCPTVLQLLLIFLEPNVTALPGCNFSSISFICDAKIAGLQVLDVQRLSVSSDLLQVPGIKFGLLDIPTPDVTMDEATSPCSLSPLGAATSVPLNTSPPMVQ
ncbi:zinc finger BED domain-containing protein RICESLEEPER 2 [Tanacetum coccineum]